MARYLAELALVDFKMMKFTPSLIGAASLYLANKILNKKESWNETLANQSNY
jgi:hypothetical protein